MERAPGMSYGQFITERIFKPMGMTQSSMPFTGSNQLIPAPFARGCYHLPTTKECTQSNISANVAEGNLVTTPDDLSQFIRKLLRGEGVLTITTVNTIMQNIPTGPLGDSRYACGITFTPTCEGTIARTRGFCREWEQILLQILHWLHSPIPGTWQEE